MKIYIVAILYVCIFLWLSYLVVILDKDTIYAENGLLENLQVLTLLVSCITFFTPVINQKRKDKSMLLFFSLLSLAFILREVDVERLDVPSILIFLGSGVGRNTLLSLGFIAIIIYAVLNFTHHKKLAKLFFSSRGGVLLIFAGIFLITGDRFEHHGPKDLHVFIEEMFELLGYVFMLVAALTFSKNRLLTT